MTFNRDFETFAGIAKEHQDHILRLSAESAQRAERRPGSGVAVGVFLAVVCAPLAALFFMRVW